MGNEAECTSPECGSVKNWVLMFKPSGYTCTLKAIYDSTVYSTKTYNSQITNRSAQRS